MKLSEQDKKKILKVDREKLCITYRGKVIRITENLKIRNQEGRSEVAQYCSSVKRKK